MHTSPQNSFSKISSIFFIPVAILVMVLAVFLHTSVAQAETLSIFSLFNSLSSQKSAQSAQPLSLSYASVNYGPVGTSVTLTGTGFSTKSNSNTVNIGKTYKIRGVSSKDGTSLTFQIPKNTKIGRYSISVSVSSSEKGKNSGKTSETLPFMVTTAGAPLPTIERIEPKEAVFGQKIKITGQNFTPKDNILSTNAGIVSGVASADGKTLTFTLPVPEYLKKVSLEDREKMFAGKNNLYWPVWVRVVNTNGPSTHPEASKFLINI